MDCFVAGQSGRIPLLVRRGGCGINKKSRSHRSAADGWSLTRKCFKTHSEPSLASGRPVRAFSERDYFFDGAATPPLQGGEYARLNSFTASIPPLQKRGWYQSFCYRPLD